MPGKVTADLAEKGDKITLIGWVGPDTPGKCKAVGGGRFSRKPRPQWVYPLDMGICRRLREVFGADLTIGPALWRWAADAKAREAEIRDLSTAETATLTEVPPAIQQATSTRTYQRTAAAWGARVGSYLLADQPGLGKTLETIASIIEHDGQTPSTLRRHLILAPKKAVGSVWGAEVARWLREIAGVRVYTLAGVRAKREATLAAALADDARGHVFVVGNIEMIRDENPPRSSDEPGKKRQPKYTYPGLFTCTWATVVADESHRSLVATSRANPTQTRWGITHLRSERRIALSGTPMRGKPQQLWGTLNWLRPDLFTSYWAWVGRYFEVEQGYTSNSRVVGDLMPGAAARMQADLAGTMLRRTKEEVLPELPPKTYSGWHLDPNDESSPFGVWLPLEGSHKTQYNRFAKDGSIEFEDGQELVAVNLLAEYTRKKQLANCPHVMNKQGKLIPTATGPKWDWLVQRITELGILDNEGDGKIVVASQFTSLIGIWAEALRSMGVKVYTLTGKTTDRAAEAMILDFQNTDNVRVFMLNTKAGGVAVTLDAADELVLVDESPVPDDQEQVEDRIHRTSRTHNVTIHYLRTLGTQDEEIAWIAACRLEVTRYIMDGSRGVEFARQLYTTHHNQKEDR